jgi:hypothetical protein
MDQKAENCDLANELPGLPQLPLETVQPESLLSLGVTTVTTVTSTFDSNEKKSDRDAAEQRIRAHGHTYDLNGLTDAEVFSDADSLDAANTRRLGMLVT